MPRVYSYLSAVLAWSRLKKELKMSRDECVDFCGMTCDAQIHLDPLGHSALHEYIDTAQ